MHNNSRIIEVLITGIFFLVFSISVYSGKAVEEKCRNLPEVVISENKSREIIIDGKLEENEWENAALLTGLINIKNRTYSEFQSVFYITYDSEFLYLAAVSPYNTAPPVNASTERDARLWREDSIELFFDPTPESIDFYQIIFNTKGTVYDQIYNKNNQFGNDDKNWNISGLKVCSKIHGKKWIVELALPVKKLGWATDKCWLFNICESRIGTGCFSICKVSKGYSDRQNFGKLYFTKDSSVLRTNSFGPISSGMAQFRMSCAGLEKNVGLSVMGKRYDETANTFFGTFNASSTVTDKMKNVFSATDKELGKSGVIEIKASAGDEVIYLNEIPYEVCSNIEFETLRVVEKNGRKFLKVISRQPYVNGKKDEIKVIIYDKSGKILKQKEEKINTARMEVFIDISSIPTGDYKVGLSMINEAGSEIKAEIQPDFTVYPDPAPWQGNKIGISDKVPFPWTPLKAYSKDGEQIVEVWNRKYVFGSTSLFPEKIISGKNNYLSSPVRLVMVFNGKELNIDKVSHGIIEQDDTQCKIKSLCQSGKLSFEVITQIEFDGFIWEDLKITSSCPGTVDNLKIQWEMPVKLSTLFHAGTRDLVGTGKTPASWNKQLNQYQGPFWIGNEKGGISFAVESFKNWSNENPRKQARIKKENNSSTVVTINIIDKKKKIEKGLSYGFCLHPTPVRPRPETLEARIMSWQGKCRTKNKYPINMSIWQETTKYFCAPDWYTSDKELEHYCKINKKNYDPSWRTYRGLKDSGVRTAWYAAYSDTARNSPETIWAGEKWKCGKKDRLYGNSLYGFYRDCIAVCKTPDYSDYFLWKLDKIKRENPLIDGIYLDLIGWKGCDREDHGHGYTDEEGIRHPTWNIREHRKWLKRLYTYLKKDDPKTPVVLHCSGQTPKIMGYSFCDYLLDGELWIQKLQEDRSYKNLRLDTFRTILEPSIWGPGILWIGQLNRAMNFIPPVERKKKPLPKWAYRHIMAMLLIHESIPTIAGNRGAEKLWKVLDNFGLTNDGKFFPYWDEEHPVKIEPETEGVVVNTYLKPDKALVIVFNNTDKDLDLDINAESLVKSFGKDVKIEVSDAETGKKISSYEKFKLKVTMRNFRILSIKVVNF